MIILTTIDIKTIVTLLLTILFFCATNTDVQAQTLPVVEKVEFQPLAAQVERVVQTLEYLGSPLVGTQQAELDLRKRARELEEQKQQLELTVARKLDEERQKIRNDAKREAAEETELNLAEREKVISDLQKQIAELKRKSEQSSQQLQGEVMELSLEELLRREFPFDEIVGETGSERAASLKGPDTTKRSASISSR